MQKNALLFVIAAALIVSLFGSAYGSGLYKCTDQKGHVEYRQNECNAGQSSSIIKKQAKPLDARLKTENALISRLELVGKWSDTAFIDSISYYWIFTNSYVTHIKPSGIRIKVRYSLAGDSLVFHREKGPFIKTAFDQNMMITDYSDGVLTIDENGHEWHMHRVK